MQYLLKFLNKSFSRNHDYWSDHYCGQVRKEDKEAFGYWHNNMILQAQ